MNKNVFCSHCLEFGHTKHECHNQLLPVDHFLQELDNRVSNFFDQNSNFTDSEDEYGKYQKLSNDSNLEQVPIEYSLTFTEDQLKNITANDEKYNKLSELGHQLNQIYDTHLKPHDQEFYLRYWSITKISQIIEWVCPNCICIPQGSSLNGTFLSTSDVDLLVFNIDKEKFEKLYKELKNKISDKHGNLNEIIGNLKFYPRRRISFIGLDDKETGIKYEIMPGSPGGIFSANRMKNFFKKFENLNLKPISMLVKSFINCIEGGKIFSGGFSSTMIMQLCQFLAMRHRIRFAGNEKVESAILFIEILDFLSNLNNFNDIVICASSEKGEFYKRPDDLKEKPFLIIMDATEKNSFLMGNISEKTLFISDQSKLFLNSIQKLFFTSKCDVMSIFPGFSIDFHYDEVTLNRTFSMNSIKINFEVQKRKTIEFQKKFIENDKVYLVVNDCKNAGSIEIEKFCIDFFRPESIFEWELKIEGDLKNFAILKYNIKYIISVDLIHELKTKDSPGCLDKLNIDDFMKKFPMFDVNIVCKHESFIKTADM